MTEKPWNRKDNKKKPLDASDMDEIKLCLWLREQLLRVYDVLETNQADDEMIDAIEHIMNENEGWIGDEREKEYLLRMSDGRERLAVANI